MLVQKRTCDCIKYTSTQGGSGMAVVQEAEKGVAGVRRRNGHESREGRNIELYLSGRAMTKNREHERSDPGTGCQGSRVASVRGAGIA